MGFKTSRSLVIWGDQLIRRGPLRPLKRLLLHSPSSSGAVRLERLPRPPLVSDDRPLAHPGLRRHPLGSAVPDVLTWRRRSASASRRARRATSTWAAPAPRSSTGSSRVTNRGTFILRIEDTDRSRSTDDNIVAIVDALRWLGLDWTRAAHPGVSPDRAARDLPRARRATAPVRPRLLLRLSARAARPRARGGQQRGETFGIPDAAAIADCRPAPCASGFRPPRHRRERPHPRPVTFEHTQLDDWIWSARTERPRTTSASCRRRHDEHHPRRPRRRPPVEHAQADPLLRGARLRRPRIRPTRR